VNARPLCATSQRSRGFALIIVVWFLVLIAAVGTYLLVNGRTETAIARNIRLAADAEALADSGIAQSAFNLSDSVESNRWKLDGGPHRLNLATGEVIVRLSDENAKINPNHASDALLAALFEASGVERTRALHLGAAIADWVGRDMMPRPLGAKLEQYRQAGLSYGPPNAPVESLDELQLVLGMTREIYDAVRPYLTVYTDGEPAAENASPVVRQALLLAERHPANDPGSDSDAPPPVESPSTTGPAPTPPDGKKADAPIISVDVIARAVAGGAFARHAVLKIDPDNPKGYAVLDWRRSNLAATD
jgi:general secretion pathway protein K